MARHGLHYVISRPTPANPIRQMPLFRPASEVFGSPALNGRAPAPALRVVPTQPRHAYNPTAREQAEHVLHCAEARVRELRAAYVVARQGIGEANRTVLPSSQPAPILRAILAAGGTVEPRRLSPEQVRARKSAAFKLLNKRRTELRAAEQALAAACAALDAAA